LLVVASLLVACGDNDASIGADLRIVLEADLSQIPDVDAGEALKSAADVIERRMDAYGATAKVRQEGANRLSVDLAGIEAAEAQELTGRTGLLEFREPKLDEGGDIILCEGGTVTYDPPACEGGQETDVSSFGWEPSPQDEESIIWLPALATASDGQETALTGRFLKPNTFVAANAITGGPDLRFEMTDEGAKLLEQVTTRLIGLPVAFFLDGEPIRGEDGRILAPTVQMTISDQAVIQGLSADDARMLSIMLNSGALPVPLQIVEVEELGE
jgi:preprotein translocase subunit SecD